MSEELIAAGVPNEREEWAIRRAAPTDSIEAIDGTFEGATTESRDLIARALDRYGTNPLSFVLRYEAPWRAFARHGGLAPYLEARRAAVVWTDPLCSQAQLPELLGAFSQTMRDERRGVCLIAVSEETARAAIDAGFSALKIGEEPRFDLSSWRPPRGDRGKKLRWAVNHARRIGVEIGQYRPSDGWRPDVEAEVRQVLESWRGALKRPEAESFLRATPLEESHLKWIFIARRNGQAEAVLSCAFLPAANEWYFEDLLRAPDAVNGATELLIVEALARLSSDGGFGAGFALAPMRGIGEQLDVRALRLARLLSRAISGIDRRYGFRAISRYEARFRPSEWRPRYIAFLPALPRPAVIRAAVRCLSG